MADEQKSGVFISHIVHESPVALVLQRAIREAFGSDFRVFVSSDQFSIGGGRKWFEHIITELRSRKVVLLLVSRESAKREWISFEAGFGDGSGGIVIPVAIINLRFSELSFPLAAYNGRLVDDIEGILYDITRETGLSHKRVDVLDYRERIRLAEDSVTYKSLILNAFWDGERIRFKLRNNGNTDLDLLMVEAWCPYQSNPGVHRSTFFPTLTRNVETLDGISYDHAIYSTLPSASFSGSGVVPLRATLTPSMGELRVMYPDYAIVVDAVIKTQRLYYQVHARNYASDRESILIGDIVP